jgi:hypothetical protein
MCVGFPPEAFAVRQKAESIEPARVVLDERSKTHGSFTDNALNGQMLRSLFRDSKGWPLATPREREALDMIAGKLARIMSGQPGFADHWVDIAGYATLASNPNWQK